jgi:putative Mg2+ transporter-C (MgtC) family protein
LHFLSATVPTLSHGQELVRLLAAALLGSVVGLERELREREAGLRTHLLVCMGAALFTLVSAYGFSDFMQSGGALVRTDPTRIAAQIVTGIGFLGAGAIIRQGLSVRGLTTAATLWLVAAIGMACGAGYYVPAFIGTGIALLTLGPLRTMSYRGLRRFRPRTEHLLVELPGGGSPGPVIDVIEQHAGRVVSMEVTQEGDRRSVVVDVQLSETAAPFVVAGVADIDGVREVRWED